MRHFYTPTPLVPGHTVHLGETLTHRLSKVLRLGQGAEIGLFSTTGGLFRARVEDPKCRTATVEEHLKSPPEPTGLHLALGLPKREALETALRQATELGVESITPLLTSYAVPSRLNTERATAILIEAAEQCERLSLPVLHPLTTLEDFLKATKTPIAWAYERAPKGTEKQLKNKEITALIGPEGGFAAEEIALLQNHQNTHILTLGPTILRVDTAVVATLARLLP